VTQVSAPRVAAPPQLQLPIDCTGPGTFTHDGFYFRIAIGFGGLGVGGSGPRGSAQIRGVSSNVTLAIGGTPSRGFVVGGAVSSASLSSPASSGVPVDVTDASSGTVAGFVDWFPNEHRGWHVGGLLGLGFMSVSSVGQSDWGGVSLGGGAFGGYDFWIGPQWSLALQAALNFTTQASLKDSNQNDTGYSLGSLGGSIQVGFVYH
jgi:hypothetical protein